jgi:D-alanyl-D-alanine carboxypeptidase
MRKVLTLRSSIAAFALPSAIILFPSQLLAQGNLTPPAQANATTNASRVRIADVPEVREALIKLDIWFEGQRLKHDLPGFAVGVVHDQELIWSKGYGFADVTNKIPATDQTLYRVASITKTFTATAVMQLVEQGKLSLEDPVSKYLPWFTPKDADPTQPVRVWNLLSHTAGLQSNAPGTDWDKLEGPDIAAMRSATRTTPLSLSPQTRLKYSNYGFMVAGELVAQLSGAPYDRYVQESVLQPLGMTNSVFLDGTETRPGLAVPYGRRLPGQARAIEQQMKQHDLMAAGGLVTSVRDLAKWASLQFNESDEYKGPVLTGRSLREMHRPRFLVADWSKGWGIGWELIRGEKRADITHLGGLPGYVSSLLISPASKVAVVLLINADDDPFELAKGAMKIVSGSIEKATTPAETPAAPAADLARFEGLYRDRWGGHVRVVALGGKLRIISLESDDIETETITLKQIGPTTFLSQAPDSADSDVESLVEFTVDPSGRATSLTRENGSDRLRRVE